MHVKIQTNKQKNINFLYAVFFSFYYGVKCVKISYMCAFLCYFFCLAPVAFVPIASCTVSQFAYLYYALKVCTVFVKKKYGNT